MAVTLATFRGGSEPFGLTLPGRVKAAEEVTVAARLHARLTALEAREGDRVRRGQPLAEFGDKETRAALGAARAELSAAELSLDVAARQHARAESLFLDRVISSREREMAESEHRGAEARRQAARAALDALEAGATLRAPFDGVVTRRHVDVGADLQPGVPVMELSSTSGLEVETDVPESALPALSRAALEVEVGDGTWRAARLERLDGMTDFRSRTRTAHLSFDGEAEPGAYALARLGGATLDTATATVAAKSLVRRGALAGVYVIEDGRARLRWLRLGREQGNLVGVLAGLSPGERYVLDPRGLEDGAAVSVRE